MVCAAPASTVGGLFTGGGGGGCVHCTPTVFESTVVTLACATSEPAFAPVYVRTATPPVSVARTPCWALGPLTVNSTLKPVNARPCECFSVALRLTGEPVMLVAA